MLNFKYCWADITPPGVISLPCRVPQGLGRLKPSGGMYWDSAGAGPALRPSPKVLGESQVVGCIFFPRTFLRLQVSPARLLSPRHGRQANYLRSLSYARRAPSAAQGQGGLTCRSCEQEHALELRSVALVGRLAPALYSRPPVARPRSACPTNDETSLL